MQAFTLDQISVIVIIVLQIAMLQALATLYYQTKEWRFLSFMIIPSVFCLAYIWIGLTTPTAIESRNVIRSCIIFGSLNVTHACFSYLHRLRRTNKRKTDAKRKDDKVAK